MWSAVLGDHLVEPSRVVADLASSTWPHHRPSRGETLARHWWPARRPLIVARRVKATRQSRRDVPTAAVADATPQITADPRPRSRRLRSLSVDGPVSSFLFVPRTSRGVVRSRGWDVPFRQDSASSARRAALDLGGKMLGRYRAAVKAVELPDRPSSPSVSLCQIALPQVVLSDAADLLLGPHRTGCSLPC